MFRSIIALGFIGAAVVGCTPKQMSYSEAIAHCQEKSDAAAGVQTSGNIRVGTGGTRVGLGLSISDSFIRGDDPKMVYNTCMENLSSNGQIIGAPA